MDEVQVEKQLDILTEAIIFMFEQGKNELLQVRQHLEKTVQQEVMLSNPMALTPMKNQKGLLVMSTVNEQLFEPLRQLDEKIAEFDTHIQALKGEDE